MRPLVIVAAILALLSASGAAASDVGPISWGKSDISYAQYRADSDKCAYAGLDAELAQKPPPILPAGMNDTLNDFLTQNEGSMMAVRHMQKVAGLAAIKSCLTQLGYRRFQLTAEQGEHLQTLRKGSEERHHYLYSLGDDTAILSVQAAPDDSTK